MAFTSGCGNEPLSALTVAPALVSNCVDDTGRPLPASDLILLDWDGGVTSLYPDMDFNGIDLSLFPVYLGGTLADQAEAFREEVRQQVISIFCDNPDFSIDVRHAEDAADWTGQVTRIVIAQSLSPIGGQIGEAEYDPCNSRRGNIGLIYAEQILRLDDKFTYDEWVLAFANTIAHEIGHTLGYAHVSRDDWGFAGRGLYVELMLPRHTIDELVGQQRFVTSQDTCPSAGNAKSAGDGVVTCGHD